MLTQVRRLPLFLALVAFLGYVCTMGGQMTINTLPLAANLAGWEEAPMVGQPLLWLLTLPCHLLPAAWLVLFLKLFAAALAAIIIALLVRSIQLLPWDDPWDHASPLAAWLPILVACVLCGLEFSFWLEATSNCGELLGLLLLAAAIWLLLEYNVRQQPRWLNAAALVWGLGMAENWVMLLAWPLFVIAVIRIERLRFFRWKFIVQLALLLLAGFSLYALQPLANSLAPHSQITPGQAWLDSLQQTKTVITLPYKIWRAHHFAVFAVTLCFLVPTLPLIVRLRDEGTRNKSGVDRFQIWLYRGLRAFLLLACCWLALDPSPGARQMLQRQVGLRLPLLTFDYLNALGAAFLAGNLLLLSRPVARDEYRRPRARFPWQRAIVAGVAATLLVVTAGLLLRNAPAIWQRNSQPIGQFGEQAFQSLPPGTGAVLSDYPDRLLVFQAALARHGASDRWLAVNTSLLPTAEYRTRLEARLPMGWLSADTAHTLTPPQMLRLLEQIGRTNRLFYLHPSYGYFFEGFYLEPAGTTYQMKFRGQDLLAPAALPDAVVQTNEQFWTSLWNRKLARLAPTKSSVPWKKLAHCGLLPAPRDQEQLLADWYSIGLQAWAVCLQKAGRWPEAQVRLHQALQLNTNNWSASISLACNTNLQAAKNLGLADVSKVAAELGNPDRVNVILNNDGPFDEPTMDFVLGSVFLDHGLTIQAAEQLERVRTLVPLAPAPQLALADIYNRLQMPDRSRALVNQVRREIRKSPPNSSIDLDLALLESYSWLLQTNRDIARSVLAAVVKEHPDDSSVTRRVLAAYLAFSDFTNAMLLVDGQLAQQPDDVAALNTKAVILIQSGSATDAIPVLNHILSLTNDLTARMNRVMAHIATKDLATAQTDLQDLETNGIAPAIVNFGRALVAERGADTNSARRYLQLSLSNAPAGSPVTQQARALLHRLESPPAQ
jgi:tetratricopeptide (TPR) repeat protein